MELQPLTGRKSEPIYTPLKAQEPVSLWSKIFFSWMHPVLFMNGKQPLENSDIFPLLESENISNETLSKYLKHYSLFFAITLG